MRDCLAAVPVLHLGDHGVGGVPVVPDAAAAEVRHAPGPRGGIHLARVAADLQPLAAHGAVGREPHAARAFGGVGRREAGARGVTDQDHAAELLVHRAGGGGLDLVVDHDGHPELGVLEEHQAVDGVPARVVHPAEPLALRPHGLEGPHVEERGIDAGAQARHLRAGGRDRGDAGDRSGGRGGGGVGLGRRLPGGEATVRLLELPDAGVGPLEHRVLRGARSLLLGGLERGAGAAGDEKAGDREEGGDGVADVHGAVPRGKLLLMCTSVSGAAEIPRRRAIPRSDYRVRRADRAVTCRRSVSHCSWVMVASRMTRGSGVLVGWAAGAG